MLKVLLDTNIIIHREAAKIINPAIGKLFRFLDKGKFTKCIHPITLEEIKKNRNSDTVDTFIVKLESYEQLQTVTAMADKVLKLSEKIDKNDNDKNDTILLNEIYRGRIDYFITEDRKIHYKSVLLGIDDRVFTIESFIEKISSENPELVDYKVLSVVKKKFGELNLSDSFFDSFKDDYTEFEKWYIKKSDETAYVTLDNGSVTSFLFLKIENKDENYADITPRFLPKNRLKIGTFKITSTGAKLSERFIKIIFDNALRYKVEEIYVTIFNKEIGRQMLVNILEEWGFKYHGEKDTVNGSENVYVRDFTPAFNLDDPKLTYPYINKNNRVFLVPIWPDYHTELLPDSVLRTENPKDFQDEKPHRNAIKKVYISRSIERGLRKGDIILFYRTAPKGKSAYYNSVITSIGIVEKAIPRLKDVNEFILKCRKRSIFTDVKLMEWWNYNPKYRPFIVNFLYCYRLPKTINLQKMIEYGIIHDTDSVPRGFEMISKAQFEIILRETGTDESIIVD